MRAADHPAISLSSWFSDLPGLRSRILLQDKVCDLIFMSLAINIRGQQAALAREPNACLLIGWMPLPFPLRCFRLACAWTSSAVHSTGLQTGVVGSAENALQPLTFPLRMSEFIGSMAGQSERRTSK